ncbi:uncharacterized protein BX663DRAFT_546842 [Cokeromyces recurvatus]|uniref:uncharacterized protein n=1 Tax=Cokeromyces recurvatus TaxID=90255 RepID=UPI00221F9085|nr:uncharacterized protein BX663DRAFT_546842 [Cokeromyces recurvatus]KAI7897889.1 hypothetical protein BX663DRAFT_546842 [Cokeromyces recurvatus]
MNEIQQKYIQLVKEITRLQWVRESLPSHSKYYEGLKKKLLKQIGLKEFSEKELRNYQNEKDNQHHYSISKLGLFKTNDTPTTTTTSSTNLIESVKFYENAIQQLQAQIDQAKIMMDELKEERIKLDKLCNELHVLYEQVIIDDPEDPTFIFEQHLKNEVEQLSNNIPNIEDKIKKYTVAQDKLYRARELIETAMKSLPGASTFMDRQAIVAKQIHNNPTSLFGKSVLVSSAIMEPIHNVEKIAQQSYQLVKEASEICPDVPLIPNTMLRKEESNVVYILTTYRGYRLKIEYVLRTQVNPRLHRFENQLAMTKYHYEQRVIEWTNHQILSLESYLRLNGYLVNESLEREISMLRMGSRAALAAVASETSERVTVDDALEISSDHPTILPEYTIDNRHLRDEQNNVSIITSHNNADESSNINLPAYYSSEQPADDLPPPAYTR